MVKLARVAHYFDNQLISNPPSSSSFGSSTHEQVAMRIEISAKYSITILVFSLQFFALTGKNIKLDDITAYL